MQEDNLNNEQGPEMNEHSEIVKSITITSITTTVTSKN